MGRVYGVPITVWESDGRPTRFQWDGRIYTVQRILDHWVTLRADWTPAADGGLPERRHWRVQAGSDRSFGVYEIRHESTSGAWLLARVWD
ncbi:DUF6504 family protein [Marinactinospora rubrisoli]|uniref:DUF6504 family protein n=1 Tax=Marinactinospora rubrisoli TaxID=2715399 RepID=A0ABW2KHJ5_9ACTN